MNFVNTISVTAVFLVLQPFLAWANQCDATKCIGGGMDFTDVGGSSSLALGKCWGSKLDNLTIPFVPDNSTFPFACEEEYVPYEFYPSFKLVPTDNYSYYSYYTCCLIQNETKVKVPQCVDNVCTTFGLTNDLREGDCWAGPYEDMTCGDNEFSFPHRTGAIAITKSARLEHYVCCDIEIDGAIAESNDFFKIFTILCGTSALISILSSITTIWMIRRSRDGFSKVSHRLITGLSISDMMFSVSYAAFGAASPSGLKAQFWNASGTHATCYCLGVLATFGVFSGPYYNASLNVYYLFVVKYEKKEEWIRKKVEPFLHLVPILIGISICAYEMAIENIDAMLCGFPSDLFPVLLAVISISFFIILLSLGMIYYKVRSQEKRMAKYGIGTLRKSVRALKTAISERRFQSSSIFRSILSFFSDIRRHRDEARARSNDSRSYSRPVMIKAMLYTVAIMLTWIFLIMTNLLTPSDTTGYIHAIGFLFAIFSPLQGFWNLLIFMYPKVIAAKKQNGGSFTWRQAFVKAFSSHKKRQAKPIRNRGNRFTPNTPDTQLAMAQLTKLETSNLRNSSLSKEQNTSVEEKKMDVCEATLYVDNGRENTAELRCKNSREEEKTEICDPEVAILSTEDTDLPPPDMFDKNEGEESSRTYNASLISPI